MQTFLVLAASAGVAAAVVWRATVPPVERVRRARPAVQERPRTPIRDRTRPSRRRALRRSPAAPTPPPRTSTRSASTPAPVALPESEAERPAAEGPDVSVVLAEAAVPDEPPSRLFALVRLILTLATVAVLAVATLAGLWMIASDRLLSGLGR